MPAEITAASVSSVPPLLVPVPFVSFVTVAVARKVAGNPRRKWAMLSGLIGAREARAISADTTAREEQ